MPNKTSLFATLAFLLARVAKAADDALLPNTKEQSNKIDFQQDDRQVFNAEELTVSPFKEQIEAQQTYTLQARNSVMIKATAAIEPDVATKVSEQALGAFSDVAPEHMECAVREVSHAQLRRNLAATDSDTAVFNIAGKDYTLKKLGDSIEIDHDNTIINSAGVAEQVRSRLEIQSWTIGELGPDSTLHGTITTVYNKDTGETVINSDFRENDVLNNVKYIVSQGKMYEVAVKIDRAGLQEAAKKHPHPTVEDREKAEQKLQAEMKARPAISHASTPKEPKQHIRGRQLALPQQGGKTVITVLFAFTDNAARDVGYSTDNPNDLSAVYAFAQDTLAYITNALNFGGINNVVFKPKIVIGRSADDEANYGNIYNVLSAKSWAERVIVGDPEALFCAGVMSQSDNTWYPAGIAAQGGCVPEFDGVSLQFRDDCAFGATPDKRVIAHEFAHTVGYIGAGHAEGQQRSDVASASNHNFALIDTIESWYSNKDYWSQNVQGRGDVGHNNIDILKSGFAAIISKLQNYTPPPPTAPTIPSKAPTKRPTVPTAPPSARPTPPTKAPDGDYNTLLQLGQKSQRLTVSAPANGATTHCTINVGYLTVTFDMQKDNGLTNLAFSSFNRPLNYGYQTNTGFDWVTQYSPQQFFEIEITDQFVQFNFVQQNELINGQYVPYGEPQYMFRVLRDYAGNGDLSVSAYNIFAQNSQPTLKPTVKSTAKPTPQPTPMGDPPLMTSRPSNKPTFSPTRGPTQPPSLDATAGPTLVTSAPSAKPTSKPTRGPTQPPSMQATVGPTFGSKAPTVKPTLKFTEVPTVANSGSKAPSKRPTRQASRAPSMMPSANPPETTTRTPTIAPIFSATMGPTSGTIPNNSGNQTDSTGSIIAGISVTTAIMILAAAIAYRKKSKGRKDRKDQNARKGAANPITELSRMSSQPPLAAPRARADQTLSQPEQNFVNLKSAFMQIKTNDEKVEFLFAMLQALKTQPSKLMTLTISKEFKELLDLEPAVKSQLVTRITPENFPGLNLAVIKDRINKPGKSQQSFSR